MNADQEDGPLVALPGARLRPLTPPRPVRILLTHGRDDLTEELAGRAGRWPGDTTSVLPAPGDPLRDFAIAATRVPGGGWDYRVFYDRPSGVTLARAREMTAVLDTVTGYLQRRRTANAGRLPAPHIWCGWVADAVGSTAGSPFGVITADCAQHLHAGYVTVAQLGRWIERAGQDRREGPGDE